MIQSVDDKNGASPDSVVCSERADVCMLSFLLLPMLQVRRRSQGGQMSGDHIRVVSWNIKFGIEIDTAIRELRQIDEVAAPDILLLQEMDEKGTARIAEALDADYVFTTLGPHQQSGRDFGNAIVSCWPIGGLAEVHLPHQARFSGHPRMATRASVSVRSNEILTYSAHTEIPFLPLRLRREQFNRLAEDVSQVGGSHSIVGGDFNTLTRRIGLSAVRSSLGEAGLSHVSAESGPTLPFWRLKLPLDHIFASGFSVVETGVAWTASASDHKPIWVDLVAN